MSHNLIMKQITELILKIADKCFPEKWNELHQFFYNFCNLNFDNNNIFNELLYNASTYYSYLMYSVLKQFSKKKMLATKMKFYPYKKDYIEHFIPFYQRMIQLFENNKNNFNNHIVTSALLKFLSTNDISLLKLIEVSYNHSEFQNDSILMNMILLILQRGANLIELINELQRKNIYSILVTFFV